MAALFKSAVKSITSDVHRVQLSVVALHPIRISAGSDHQRWFGQAAFTMRDLIPTERADWFSFLEAAHTLIHTCSVPDAGSGRGHAVRASLPLHQLDSSTARKVKWVTLQRPKASRSSRVLPEQDQDGNIWICAEGGNCRSSPTRLILSQQVVYFGPALWSTARFLRSNHQVTGTDRQ